MNMGIIDDLTKSPGLIAVLGVGVLALVFRDKISSFLSGVSGGAETVSNLGQTGNILSGNLLGNLTGLQDVLKGVTDFKFPEIKFPDFNFEFPSINLDVFPTPSTDFTETAQNEARANRSRDVFTQTTEEAQREIENFNVQTGLDTGQQFQGGGLSFIGGTVRETPITGESTLGFIIDKLGVSASRASSIRAELRGFTPEEQDFLNPQIRLGDNTTIFQPNPPSTSGGFEGLTPEEIALRLTGGNISNF